MNIFKERSMVEFTERFKTDEDCKKYLSDLKWEKGYVCRRCRHNRCQVRKDYSRTCNICSHTESSTANTLFHKVKFGLRKAFLLCFEINTASKSLSTLQTSLRYGIQENTARLFMHKVKEIIRLNKNNIIEGIVHNNENLKTKKTSKKLSIAKIKSKVPKN